MGNIVIWLLTKLRLFDIYFDSFNESLIGINYSWFLFINGSFKFYFEFFIDKCFDLFYNVNLFSYPDIELSLLFISILLFNCLWFYKIFYKFGAYFVLGMYITPFD